MLDPDKIAKLSAIGFSLVTTPKVSFDERAVQWLQYRNQHGRDPSQKVPGVGSWMQHTRGYYTRFQRGEKVPITAEQIDQLKRWGFKFETGVKKPVNPAKPKSWEGRFEELLQYKEEHGHVNIPQKCEYEVATETPILLLILTVAHLIVDPVLGQWVKQQRKDYTDFKTGKKSAMTQERIDRLKVVGFKFVTRKRRPRSDGSRVVLPEDEYDGNVQDHDSSSEDEGEARPQASLRADGHAGSRVAQAQFP